MKVFLWKKLKKNIVKKKKIEKRTQRGVKIHLRLRNVRANNPKWSVLTLNCPCIHCYKG